MSSNFVPAIAFISNITQAQNAVVTFTAAHSFSNGEYISFRVIKPYGMVEINDQRALVVSNDTLTVTVNLDTSFFTPFVFPAPPIPTYSPNTPPCAVPAGSGILPNYVPPTVTLFDSFDNVIPGVGGQ